MSRSSRLTSVLEDRAVCSAALGVQPSATCSRTPRPTNCVWAIRAAAAGQVPTLAAGRRRDSCARCRPPRAPRTVDRAGDRGAAAAGPGKVDKEIGRVTWSSPKRRLGPT